jgi:DNA-binding beta-propeller fold protein YncE
MRFPRWSAGAAVGLALCAAAGCEHPAQQPAAAVAEPGKWVARSTGAMAGFIAPQAVTVDPATGAAYISSAGAAAGQGFISRASAKGLLEDLRWRESTAQVPLAGPGGMAILNSSLYVADGAGVVRLPIVALAPAAKIVEVPAAKRLTGAATGTGVVFITDAEAGTVSRISSSGEIRSLKGPPGAGAVAFLKGKLFCVSTSRHDVYELDPSGVRQAVPFGLASHFKDLSGVEVLDDGTLIVSDSGAGQVYTIDPDRRTVRPLLNADSPGGLALDRPRGILYVPEVKAGRVAMYKIEERK